MAETAKKVNEADFKTQIFREYFGKAKFIYRQEIDRIDFIITDNADRHLIWAETKKNTADIVEMFVQLEEKLMINYIQNQIIFKMCLFSLLYTLSRSPQI